MEMLPKYHQELNGNKACGIDEVSNEYFGGVRHPEPLLFDSSCRFVTKHGAHSVNS